MDNYLKAEENKSILCGNGLEVEASVCEHIVSFMCCKD